MNEIETGHAMPTLPRFTVDLLEHGGPLRGEPQAIDARLFFQLQVFTGCLDTSSVVEAVRASGLASVVYLDASDPRGIGVVVITEDPEEFVGRARTLLSSPPFSTLTPRPEFTMTGRTYATGREPDLSDWLLTRQKNNALDPDSRWAIWYPLRRIGAFNRLPKPEQGPIMAEHATIGRAYGEAGHAHDIRLECHGLDRDDNEFVIAVVGPNLHPLSKLIKDMRPTKQTSEYIEKMGPFFVGHAAWRNG